MQSKRLIAVLMTCLAFMGCRETKDTAMDVQILVGLQRTPCFGQCPVYELSVLNTGEATLTVGRFCEEALGRSLAQGLHRAKVDVGMWRMVADLASDMGFDTLQTKYDDPKVMDLPANIITIEGKTVFNRYGGPDLNELYTRIERMAGAADWQADAHSVR